MKHLFLYCPDTVIPDTVNYFSGKGYATAPLDDNPQTFWDWVNAVDQDGILVILSHGDPNGPLMVKGHRGDDMTAGQIVALGARLVMRNISLYLLSCESGQGEFAIALAATGAHFIAPLGNAQVNSNSVGVNVYSKDDKGKNVGWYANGVAAPRRSATPLLIPSA